MSGRDDHPPADQPSLPVPRLIEQYRQRRQAWMAQADELARLRDEVRGSAEKEAMEIITAARRDVRRIVMEARRELLVLSTQVQAALGEAAATAPGNGHSSHLPSENGDGDELPSPALVEDGWGFLPAESVKSVLEEVRADIVALAEDARAMPFRQPSPPPGRRSPVEGNPAPPAERVAVAAAPAAHHAPRVLLSSAFPAVSSPVQSGRSMRTFVAFLALAAIAVVAGTLWALRRPTAAASRPPAAATAAVAPVTSPTPRPPAADTPAATTPAPPARRTSNAPLYVSLEARRDAWVRATIDGLTDAGRTLGAGTTFTYEATSTISLRIGDAGAVLLSLNGGEARPVGRDGQVITRRFSVDPQVPSGRPASPQATAIAAEPAELQPASPQAQSSPIAALPPVPAPALPPPPAAVAATNGLADAPPATGSPRATPAATTPPFPDTTLIAAANQWLDAYHRQDRAALAALATENVALLDERPMQERFPSSITAVARTLERVNIQVAGDTAVLTGVMIERAVGGGLQRSSPVSLVWVANDGKWRLGQARLVTESRLNQIFR